MKRVERQSVSQMCHRRYVTIHKPANYVAIATTFLGIYKSTIRP